jgi:penicillin-binding protein 2
MQSDSERQKLFSRRAALLAGGKAVLLSTLVGRMYFLQVVEAERYATLAEANRINLRLLAPARGRIVDRFGQEMAINRQNYRVILIAEQAQDVEASLRALGSIISISDGEHSRILREINRKRHFVPVTVEENLSWGQVAHIEVNAPDLPGVMIDVGRSRYYPDGKSAAHILGFVAVASEDEARDDPLFELPGFRIGKMGVEKVNDLALRGKGGTSQVEVNAFGRVIREVSRADGKPGTDVALSIDAGLQGVVARRLKEETAAAVVIDVHSGEVLAMASSPNFDPNDFNKGLTTEAWQKVVSDEKAPLVNRAIAGQYSPGSTFKMVVALAALEKGIITPKSEFFCSGMVSLGNTNFHCWKRHGHGVVDLVQAISQSCDVYFYEISRRVGLDRITAMARKMGVGEITEINLTGEKAGFMPTKDWKLAVKGAPWQIGETMLSGIGQGYILTTPLQLAVMTARLVNGGRAVKPRILREIKNIKGSLGQSEKTVPSFDDLGLSPENLKVIRKAMDSVVNDHRGTAYRSRISNRRLAMGGKTGTVQVRTISEAERETGVRKNEDLPWKERDHALFVGYGPISNPRYAVSVVVEHGGGGSKVAAPIARDILMKVLGKGGARNVQKQDQNKMTKAG